MKNKITGNEPANPVMHADGTFTGLTIRQHFSAMAMQGLLANLSSNNPSVSNLPFNKQAAKASVMIADALIEELNMGITTETPAAPTQINVEREIDYLKQRVDYIEKILKIEG